MNLIHGKHKKLSDSATVFTSKIPQLIMNIDRIISIILQDKK